MDSEDRLDALELPSDDLGGAPPIEEDDRGEGGGGGGPAPPTAPVARWLALIALGVAIERTSMLVLVSDAAPVAQVIAAVLFLAVPIAAGFVVVRAFLRAQEADRRGLRPWTGEHPIP